MGYPSCPTSGAFRLRQNLKPVNRAHKKRPPCRRQSKLNFAFLLRRSGVGLKKLVQWPLVGLLRSTAAHDGASSPLTAAAGWGELAKNAG